MENMIKVRAGKEWLGDWGFGGENLWANKKGADKAVLANTPFFAYGLSLEDTVSLNSDGDIVSIVERGPFSTFRAMTPKDGGLDGLQRGADAIKVRFPEAAVEGDGGILVAFSIKRDQYEEAVSFLEASRDWGIFVGWEEGAR